MPGLWQQSVLLGFHSCQDPWPKNSHAGFLIHFLALCALELLSVDISTDNIVKDFINSSAE